jgi:Protein of unknown function (DUF4232)
MKRLLVAVFAVAIASLPAAHARGPGACLGRDLTARAAFQGGTGAQEGGVALRNRVGHSCLLSGRATIDFVAGGRALSLPVRVAVGRATDGRIRDRTILLAPGQRAFVHSRWSNWCGERYGHVTVRLWLRSVEPRVHVRGVISSPRCDDNASASRVAIGPYERVRLYPP